MYSSIMEHGYYLTGVKEDSDCTYIAIVLTVANKDINPFEHVGEASTVIAETVDGTYYAVCVGIDSTGEFFCKVD